MKKQIPKKETRGGVRAGAGIKLPKEGPYAGEKKANITGARLYPTQTKNIVAKHGSLQKGIDWLAEQARIDLNGEGEKK